MFLPAILDQYGNYTSARTLQEEWRWVVGYEGLYIISNYAEIYSYPRISTFMQNNSFKERAVPGRYLSPTKGFNGYLFTSLYINGIQSKYYVHSLVAEAFIGSRPLGYDVCHNDGNKDNNCVLNLRYGTRKENIQDTFLHGTKPTGDKCSQSIYSNEQIANVKLLLKTNKQCDVARITNIPVKSIQRIKQGKSWKHVIV